MRIRLTRWPVTAALTVMVLFGSALGASATEDLIGAPADPAASGDLYYAADLPAGGPTETAEGSVQEGTEQPAALGAPVLAAAGSNGTCPASVLQRVTDVEYEVNGAVVPRLRGNVSTGQTVTVRFLIDPDCTDPVEVSLVSYFAPKATFDPTKADQQKVADAKTGFFAPSVNNPAKYSLTVDVPDCFFQVDFVRGAVITTLGPKGSNNFYSAQGRLVDSAEGGTAACVQVKAEDPKVNGSVQSADAEVAGVTLARTGSANGVLAVFGFGLTGLGCALRWRARLLLGDLPG